MQRRVVEAIIEAFEAFGFYVLLTCDREGNTILKVYSDPGLTREVAVFRVVRVASA